MDKKIILQIIHRLSKKHNISQAFTINEKNIANIITNHNLYQVSLIIQEHLFIYNKEHHQMLSVQQRKDFYDDIEKAFTLLARKIVIKYLIKNNLLEKTLANLAIKRTKTLCNKITFQKTTNFLLYGFVWEHTYEGFSFWQTHYSQLNEIELRVKN